MDRNDLLSSGSRVRVLPGAHSQNQTPAQVAAYLPILRVDRHDARLRFRARAAQLVTGELAQRVRDLVLGGASLPCM